MDEPTMTNERDRKVTEVIYFRACPRCQGDMHDKTDIYGQYKECLQCGHMLDAQKRYKKHLGLSGIKRYAGKEGEAA